MKTFCLAGFVLMVLLVAQHGFCDDTSNPSTLTVSRKDILVKEEAKKKPERNIIPAYLNYIPFSWESFQAVTQQELVNGLHKGIRIGLGKEQATNTRKSMVKVVNPADIDTLRTLLRNRYNTSGKMFLGEPRLLFDADRGETQIFVYRTGMVSQENNQWRMSPEDFMQLKQMLNRIYENAP